MISFLKNKSRSRRLQYEWLAQNCDQLDSSKKVLDLGGVAGAEYHAILGLPSERIVVWNFDLDTKPDQVVDLDNVETLPGFPQDCSSVLALNLLEHLYRPFDLLKWVCENLPPQGKLIALVPFAYPIHPSPKDYWRITPQAFEHFFIDLSEKLGIRGRWVISPLAIDFREGTSSLTASLFKGRRTHQLLGSALEATAFAASVVGKVFIGKERVRDWAKQNPPAIGVVWVKD